MTFAISYTVLLCLLAAFTVIIVVKAFCKRDQLGILLGIISVFLFFTTATYLASALADKYHIVNITANLYFIGVDIIVAIFIRINMIFTKTKMTKARICIYCAIWTFVVYEALVFVINIFNHAAVNFVPLEGGIPPYFKYEMHTLYYIHLFFTYLIIACVVYQIIRTMRNIPHEYRDPYTAVLVVIIFIIIINATFLFVSGNSNISRFDTSLPGYYLILFFVYWSNYYYSKKGMLLKFKDTIVEHVEQGILLFNYEQDLILFNQNASNLLVGIDLNKKQNLTQFLASLNLPVIKDPEGKPVTFQIAINNNGQTKTLRCTSSIVFNKKNKILGYLFSFSDTEFENDVLTGFQSVNAFKNLTDKNPNFLSIDCTLSILDINGLGVINAARGHAYGDQVIQSLAGLMREYFPKNSYFVRGREAILAVFSPGVYESTALKICERIKKEMEYPIQYAVTAVNKDEPLNDAAERGINSLNTRKIMDNESTRSEALNSLIKALNEVDSDTKDHVKRTEFLARALGEKLNLSQVEQTNLSLLSVLHDIGKIAIPLEILNKPSRLTDEEWEVMKSHTTKGYNIAISSPMLKCIANEILHHHERWDGRGYPNGLSKETIPLLSRIVSVVDSYDAMVSDRPYRKGMSQEKAIEEIERCSGTQFDPLIASEFIKLICKDRIKYQRENAPSHTIVDQRANESLGNDIKDFATVYHMTYSKYILDNNNLIISTDENFESITGYSNEDIKKGINQFDLLPEEDKLTYSSIVQEQIGKKGMAYLEHRLKRKDGTIMYVFCMGRLYYDSAVKENRNEIIMSSSDSSHSVRQYAKSQEEKAAERLRNWEKMYRTDSLTGLMSHVPFENDVTHVLSKKEYKVAFAMMDLDYFKKYNDTYGHHEGDKYLIHFANTLIECIGEIDIASRMGGDEFAVLIHFPLNTPDEEIIMNVKKGYEKIDLAFKTSYKNATSISVGVSISSDKLDSFDKLYEAADKALYQVKEKGRGNIAFYKEEQ